VVANALLDAINIESTLSLTLLDAYYLVAYDVYTGDDGCTKIAKMFYYRLLTASSAKFIM
jgi:hypothetical protein